MSKVDAMRALREARYNAAPKGVAPPRAAAAPVARPAARAGAPVPVGAAGLCGHRSMNNRSCTRDAGHPEKNHRYS